MTTKLFSSLGLSMSLNLLPKLVNGSGMGSWKGAAQASRARTLLQGCGSDVSEVQDESSSSEESKSYAVKRDGSELSNSLDARSGFSQSNDVSSGGG